MKLKLTNEQKLILSQKMQQSLKLLQMNSHELETYLNELSMENPLIEVVPPREMPPSHEKQFSARTTTDPDIMSRTVRSKYISCRWGMFCLADFFKQSSTGENVTEDGVLRMIKDIIAAEDPRSPLSDKAIAEKLSERGVSISRRTVAKYRENAMIPSTTGRRKR